MDLSMVWYVDAEGASWKEAAPGSPRPRESYRPTGGHELWLLDGNEVLARAGDGLMACAITRGSRAI